MADITEIGRAVYTRTVSERYHFLIYSPTEETSFFFLIDQRHAETLRGNIAGILVNFSKFHCIFISEIQPENI